MTSAHTVADTFTAKRLGKQAAHWLVAHPWITLVVWSYGIATAHLPFRGLSWHYFVTAVHAFFSAHPLSIFAAHPELQMGPLTFLVTAPFVLIIPGVAGQFSAMAFMVAIGLLAVREIRTIAADRLDQRSWLVSSLLIMAVWTELAIYWGHLDDAFALYFGLLGLRLVRTGHPFAAAVALAVSVDFKPWAAPLVALLLLAPARRWIPLGAIWIAVVAIVWLPFFLGDSSTSAALHFGIKVDPASTLHLLGVRDSTTPPWVREAQIFGGFALAILAIWRRRWASVFLIVLAVRLLLDPGTKNYYDTGLLVGAGVLDVALSRIRVPLASIGAFVLVYLPSHLLQHEPAARGVIRTVALVVLIGIALVWPNRHEETLHADRPESPSPTALDSVI